VILVGENKASEVYVQRKRKMCRQLGFFSIEHNLPETISEVELLQTIHDLNKNPRIHGILVQLPLPSHLKSSRILNAVSSAKDVDGFTHQNAGRLYLGEPAIEPCTPKGIIRILKHYQVPLAGQHAVVLGRSAIVGKPISMLLLKENCTVTVCHSKSKDLATISKDADILIAAIGKSQFVRGNFIKEGAAIIDVGINRLENGKLAGDVAFAEAAKKAAFITPVPGGVGPMTIAMLMENTLESAMKIQDKQYPFGTIHINS
jgi:methylenetetrahydrofolate dehydrogenase (NADP+)/methenyltetrahydrofolate cyclohydrolase